MMKFELGLERPEPRRAFTGALTIAAAYIGGGLIPLSPYMLVSTATVALIDSVIVTSIALLLSGDLHPIPRAAGGGCLSAPPAGAPGECRADVE